MRQTGLVGTGVIVLALLACKQKETSSSADTSPTPETPSAAASPAAPGASLPVAPAAPPSFEVGAVPEIPSGRSNPPQGGEWDQGVAVNTQGAGARAKRCTMRVLREWLNVYCTGSVIGYEKKEDFGTLGVDYYEKIVAGKYASFVIRLKSGENQKIRICRESDRASLFVSWPPSASKPLHVALGQGPKCDGSDWGAGYGKKGGGSYRASAPGSGDDSGDARALEEMRARDATLARACSSGQRDACVAYCGAPACK